jgi:hypothetical protein
MKVRDFSFTINKDPDLHISYFMKCNPSDMGVILLNVILI